MIKNFAKRKFIITSFAFFIFFITLLFPNKEENTPTITTNYISGKTTPIFLLNSNNYVSKTEVVLKNNDLLKQVEELISFLTVDNPNKNILPSIFFPIIPKGTKILSLDIQDKLLKINFNQEFLDIPEKYSEQLIECLVYTLTEFENIDEIMILIDGKILENYPNSSKKLPHILKRDIGVNKIYNFDKIYNVTKTTTYYLAKEHDISYYIPVTLLENNSKDKVEIIIERLKSNPHLQTNLMSYLNAGVELNSYELLEEEIKLSFDKDLYEGLNEKDLQEKVKYSIFYSLKDTLNVKNVVFQN